MFTSSPETSGQPSQTAESPLFSQAEKLSFRPDFVNGQMSSLANDQSENIGAGDRAETAAVDGILAIIAE